MRHPTSRPVSGAHQVASNALALLLAYVIPRAFTVVAVIVAARVLGAADFGVYGAAAALAVLLSVVASLGMHPLLVREIAKDPGAAGPLIRAAHRVKAGAGAVMLLGSYVAARVLFPGEPGPQAATVVLAVGWVLHAFAENLSAYFQAVERMRRWTEASALFGVVSATVGIALLLGTGSLVAFCLGFPAGWAAALVWLGRGIPPEARARVGVTSGSGSRLVGRTLPFALAFVALTLYCKVDVLLLRAWRGDVQVGLYAAAYKFVDVFQALVIVAAGAVYPRLARAAGTRDPGPWAGTRATELLLLASVPAGMALHLVAPPLVLVLFGPGYQEAGAVLAWLAALLPLLAMSLHSGYVLGAAGRILPMAALYAMGVALNIALNAWLIPERGAEGAALARLGSEAVLAAAFLGAVGAVAGAAPRLKAVVLAGAVATVGVALGRLPDPSGGWLRGALLVTAAAALYGVAGAAQPGEARAVLAALGLGGGRVGARGGNA